MTAINAYKEHECNMIDIGTKEKFLRVAAIYLWSECQWKVKLEYSNEFFSKNYCRILKQC